MSVFGTAIVLLEMCSGEPNCTTIRVATISWPDFGRLRLVRKPCSPILGCTKRKLPHSFEFQHCQFAWCISMQYSQTADFTEKQLENSKSTQLEGGMVGRSTFGSCFAQLLLQTPVFEVCRRTVGSGKWMDPRNKNLTCGLKIVSKLCAPNLRNLLWAVIDSTGKRFVKVDWTLNFLLVIKA